MKAGAYLRLSKEDKNDGQSTSIETQKIIINNFAKENNFKIEKYYADDGYSGTTFERPAFKEMISDIYNSKINCVIVKDLSRFGRNYIESGIYIERLFPYLNVRFIAIADNYDSNKNSDISEEMLLIFKNLINDIYSADISIKTKSSLKAKMERGDFIGAFAVYGYKKENKTLILDPIAGKVVKLIFYLKIKGYNNNKIAKILNEADVLTPMDYKLKNGEKYRCGFKSNIKSLWNSTTVKRILENEIYTGKLIQGKTKSISFRNKKRQKTKGIIGETKHIPIIPENIFKDVKKIMERDTRTSPKNDNVYLFSGMLFCGDCGSSVIRKKNGKHIYFMCSANKNNKNICSSHRISEKKLILEITHFFSDIPITRENIIHFIDKIYIYENGKCEIRRAF